MKTSFKYIILVFVSTMLILGSCQQEVIEITEPEDNTVLTSADSIVAGLIQSTTMRDGSGDNILDNSSCTTLVLPVTVIVNGEEIIINTEEDFKLVERLLDESDTDDDSVAIMFPVVVILADHTELTISNEEEFEALLEDCIEDGGDEDIECIDFVYPLDISVYDATSQVTDIITVTNDEELYDLFESLNEEDVISFNFPLTLILADSTTVEVNNNNELEQLIKDVEDTCDEDDDNDYNEDDVDDTDLVVALLDGEWAITYFFAEEADSTIAFNNHVFTFFDNGIVEATDSSAVIEGAWITYGDDGYLELEFNFGEVQPLDQIEEDWYVLEFTADKIRLSDSQAAGGEEFLTLEKL